MAVSINAMSAERLEVLIKDQLNFHDEADLRQWLDQAGA